jgi:hypothetical protein
MTMHAEVGKEDHDRNTFDAKADHLSVAIKMMVASGIAQPKAWNIIISAHEQYCTMNVPPFWPHEMYTS